LAFIFLLAGLCIVGAFLGASKASEVFNSIPLGIFWTVLAISILASLFVFKSLWKSVGLLALHLGALLIILAGLWSSKAGHEFRANFLGEKKAFEGVMELLPDKPESQILSVADYDITQQLDFELQLKKASIEFYPPYDSKGILYFSHVGELGTIGFQKLNWQFGQAVTLGSSGVKIRILECDFQKSKLASQVENDFYAIMQFSYKDLTVKGQLIVPPDKHWEQLPLEFLFEDMDSWQKAGFPRLALKRPQRIKNYNATVVVYEKSKEAARKTIKVNKPLRYGGYHFYFTSFLHGLDNVLLKVKSDSGLNMAYAGFALLGLGAFLQFWILPVIRSMRKRGPHGG